MVFAQIRVRLGIHGINALNMGVCSPRLEVGFERTVTIRSGGSVDNVCSGYERGGAAFKTLLHTHWRFRDDPNVPLVYIQCVKRIKRDREGGVCTCSLCLFNFFLLILVYTKATSHTHVVFQGGSSRITRTSHAWNGGSNIRWIDRKGSRLQKRKDRSQVKERQCQETVV